MASISVNTIDPCDDVVVVRTEEPENVEVSPGGVHLPDDAKPVIIRRIGTVVAVGPNVGRCEVDDRVLFSAYAGTPIEVGGEELELMFDVNILAIVS